MRAWSLIDEDQQAAIDRLYSFDSSLLVAGMGAGKTIIAETAISELIKDESLKRVLVIAPKRVATEVWSTEHLLWDHLKHLNVLVVAGTPDERVEQMKRAMDADIIVINFEQVGWWFKHYNLRELEIDGLLVDELSRLKEAKGTIFKTLRPRIPDFAWRCGMTGTPVAEDFEGLFGQMYIVDAGATFGRNRMKFLNENFFPTDYDQHQWAVRESRVEYLLDAVAPYVHTMPDYTHTLPPLNVNPVWVELPPKGRELYDELAHSMVLENEEDVTAVNAAVLTNKLQQAASGFVYRDNDDPDDVKPPLNVHEAKWLKLGELIATHPEPTMLVYWYRYQYTVLARYGITVTDEGAIEQWNRGDARLMLAHPKSCGHGLNLQYGGHRQLWCGPIWPNDLWLQTVARLWRRGQQYEVDVDVVCARDTVDEAILARLQGKQEWDQIFREHMERYKNPF